MYPIQSWLTFPEERPILEERQHLLGPFVARGFNMGESLNALYEQVKGTTLSMRRSTFLDFAGEIYSELKQATSVQTLAPDESFNISDLPRKESNMEERFWARIKISYTLPTGERDFLWLSYGFNDKMTMQDIQDEAFDAWSGFYFPEDLNIDSMNVMEMYRRF